MQQDLLTPKRHRAFRSRYPDRVTEDVVEKIIVCGEWPALLHFELSKTDLPVTGLVFERKEDDVTGYVSAPGAFQIYGVDGLSIPPSEIPAGNWLKCVVHERVAGEVAYRVTYTYAGETKTAVLHRDSGTGYRYWQTATGSSAHYVATVAPVHSGPFELTIDATNSDLDVTGISARVVWSSAGNSASLSNVTAGNVGSPYTINFTGNGHGWRGIQVEYTVGGQQRSVFINRPRPSDPASATVAVVFNATAPSALALSNTYLLDGSNAPASVGAFSCTDADSTAGEITYSLVDGAGGDDNDFFNITSSGVLCSLFGASYATKNSYAIRVRATDQTGLYCEQTFTVSIFEGLEFIGLTDKTYGDAAFALQSKHAYGTSVTYAVVSGPATIFGSTLTITGAGTVTVQVQQGATTVQASFAVVKKSLTVTAQAASRSYGEAEPIFQTVLTGFVDGETADVVAGAASMTTDAASGSAPGNYTITPAQGTLLATNYSFDTFVTATLVVSKAAQSISVGALPSNAPIGGLESLSASATSSSGLPVTLTLESGSVATLSGSPGSYTLDDIGESGTVTIKANQAGNDNYLAASEVVRVIVVTKSNQTITFTAPSGLDAESAPVTLNGTASSNLTVAYTVVSGPASVSGNTLTVTGVGTVTVKASQSGDGTYNAALDVSRTFSVASVSDESIIPAHTGYASDFGTASADAEHVSGGQTYYAWRAFDGNTADSIWGAASNATAGIYGATGWLLSYTFTNPQVIRGYAIHGCPDRGAYYTYTPPRTWTFEGWNGTSWVVLDRQVEHASGVGAFFFSNPNNVAYQKIRLNMTDSQVNVAYGNRTGIQIAELQVF